MFILFIKYPNEFYIRLSMSKATKEDEETTEEKSTVEKESTVIDIAGAARDTTIQRTTDSAVHYNTKSHRSESPDINTEVEGTTREASPRVSTSRAGSLAREDDTSILDYLSGLPEIYTPIADQIINFDDTHSDDYIEPDEGTPATTAEVIGNILLPSD